MTREKRDAEIWHVRECPLNVSIRIGTQEFSCSYKCETKFTHAERMGLIVQYWLLWESEWPLIYVDSWSPRPGCDLFHYEREKKITTS